MGKKRGKGSHKGTPKGTPKTTPRRSGTRPASSPRSQVFSKSASHFSLRDEAQYMSSHRSAAFDTSKKLRLMPITFVSAGCLQGTVEEKPEPEPEPEPQAQPDKATDALAQMSIRSPSPAPSASSSASGDLVVFRGRGHTPLPVSTKEHREDTASAKVSSHIIGVSPEGEASRAKVPSSTLAIASVATDKSQSLSHDQKEPGIDSDTDCVVDTHFKARRGGRPVWDTNPTPWVSRSKPGIGWLPCAQRPDMESFMEDEVDPRDAAMDDYMQNVEDFGLVSEMVASTGFANREMDLDAGDHNDWQEDEENVKLTLPAEIDDDSGWNSDDLRDLDDISTSSDIEDTIAKILRGRTRGNGRQYLVIYEGSTPDDARWLPATFFISAADQKLVEEFEALELSRVQNMVDTSSTDSGGDDEDDSDSMSDSEPEIDDPFGVDMDDEQLARALQRQEELGIDSDDLALFAADDYPMRTNSARAVGPRVFDRPSKKRQQRAGGRGRREPNFPSASAMADALSMDPYGAFDIMDTDRPSLRMKKKGRRGQLPPELEDPDLTAQLRASWEADRQKKRIKKAEREEMRSLGLLGRKGKGPNLKVKYKDGVVMEEVIEEIRTFMDSDMQTLSLPPMEAQRRATVHQFVHNLGLTSRSRGDGQNRFTVLSKTSRTIAFDDEVFDALLERKKFKNRLLRAGQMAGAYPKKERGTSGRPTVSYRDGEIVGASAPELGPENKGRALLEKMGWSKGQALGAMDNKGILQPITHTVKITKAGLR